MDNSEQIIEQPTKQPVEQPTEQPVEQSTEQPEKQTPKQPVLDEERVAKNKIIIEKIALSEDEEEIRSEVDKLLPNWFKYAFNDYSDDYPHLKSNWEIMCNNLNCKRQKIICVKSIPLAYNEKIDENFFEIQAVIEILSRKGYIIRRENELIACEVCKKAIISHEIYHQMKKLNKEEFQLPEVWSKYCMECQ